MVLSAVATMGTDAAGRSGVDVVPDAVRSPGATTSQSRKDAIISRREIEGQIADGRHIVIFEGRVLRVDAWLKYHPGGDKAIQHMVGRDATDEINAYVVCFLLPMYA